MNGQKKLKNRNSMAIFNTIKTCDKNEKEKKIKRFMWKRLQYMWTCVRWIDKRGLSGLLSLTFYFWLKITVLLCFAYESDTVRVTDDSRRKLSIKMILFKIKIKLLIKRKTKVIGLEFLKKISRWQVQWRKNVKTNCSSPTRYKVPLFFFQSIDQRDFHLRNILFQSVLD